MKPHKTVIFIFAVILGLAFICLIFPKDGIRMGNITLEFPTLSEAIAVEDPVDEEALMREAEAKEKARKDSLRNVKDAELLNFINRNVARFYMPKDDVTYFDDLFRALENAKKKPTRIMHYGDSQIECDLMSATMREYFQEEFGGMGPGIQPAVQPVGKNTVLQTTSPEDLNRKSVYGMGDKTSSGNYGVIGQMSHVDGSASFSFSAYSSKKPSHANTYNKVSVVMRGSGSIACKTRKKSYDLKPETKGDGVRIYSTTLDEPLSNVTVSVSGSMDIYGIMLDGDKGVAFDNISMRGCSGTIFTSISEASMSPFFTQRDVSLIILQYGGNAVAYLTNKSSLETYSKQIRAQLRYMKKMAPKARILFIGPSDMATLIHGKQQSYPNLPDVIDMLRRTANEEGCAYWDMYAAMGGEGTMVKWVKQKPALAYTDYVHFTPKGSTQVSTIFLDMLKLYHNYYKFRQQK